MSKITEIDEEIAQKMLKVEEFGEKGDADNSFKALEEVEELKKKKVELEVSEFFNFSYLLEAIFNLYLRV